MARRRRARLLSGRGLPDALVLDSGPLSAAAGGEVRVRAELSLAEQLGVEVHMSSVTLAETLRGHPRDARFHAALADVPSPSEPPSALRKKVLVTREFRALGGTRTPNLLIRSSVRALIHRAPLVTVRAKYYS